jgi:hypothetical protein
MVMDIQFTEEQQARIKAQADKQGYDDLAAYLLALVEVDAEEDILDDEEDVVADFREAWHQAMTGQTRPARESLARIRPELIIRS